MTTLDAQLAAATAEAERLRQMAAERDAHTERLRQIETDEAARKAAVAARTEAAKALPASRITSPRAKALKALGQYQSARVAAITALRDYNTAISAEHDDFIAAGFDLPAGTDYTTGARRDLAGPTVVRDGSFDLTVLIAEILTVVDRRVDTAQLGTQAFTPQVKLPRVAQIVDQLPQPPAVERKPRVGADIEFPTADNHPAISERQRQEMQRQREHDERGVTVNLRDLFT